MRPAYLLNPINPYKLKAIGLFMRIAVVSDLHLGFQFGTERGEDAFRNASEAFAKAVEEKVDLILIPGDIFHDKVPRPEVMSRSIDLFKMFSVLPTIKITNTQSHGKEESVTKEIPAVVTIYGTHEKRNPGRVNPIQLLEKAGLLTHLHAESIVVEVGKERIGLHGLSGVPDQFAKQALEAWAPKPFPQVLNLFMIHQTFRELIPDVKQDVVSYANLPTGFNLYILGHVHWRVEDKHPFTDAPIIVPGSTIRTQLRKIEADRKKGLYILDFTSKKLDIKFVELQSVRDFYYEALNVTDKKPSEILGDAHSKIAQILTNNIKQIKPIIRFKLKGTLAEGFLPADLNFNPLKKKFAGSLLYFDRTKVESSQLSERAKLLYDLKQKKVSIEEIGMKLLLENMKITDPLEAKRVHEMFEQLVEGTYD